MKETKKDINEEIIIIGGITFVVPLIIIVAGLIQTLIYSYILKSTLKKDVKRSKSINNMLGVKDKWSVYILDEKMPTAFCFISKNIYISKGLEKILNEREIMAVLLHEAYHIKNYHVLQRLIARYPLLMIIFTTFINFPFINIFILAFFILLIRNAHIISDVLIGRIQELNADTYPVKFGYADEIKSALEKLIGFYNKIRDSQGYCDMICKFERKINELLDEHPSLEKRVRNILKSKKAHGYAIAMSKKQSVDIKRIKEFATDFIRVAP